MKIKSQTLPEGFRNFFIKYKKESELSNWGALRNLPQEISGRQAPPFFPINRGGGLFRKCSSPLGYAFRLFWVKKHVSVKKNWVEVCHTLISSGDLCLMTCGFSLVLVRCLAPIIMQFVKFRDMPKNKRKYWCTIHKVPWHTGNQMEASLHK